MWGAWPSVVALPMLLRIAHGLRIDMTWPITEHDADCHAPFLEPVSTFDGPTYAAPGPFGSDAQASIEIELRVRATQNVTHIAPAGRVFVRSAKVQLCTVAAVAVRVKALASMPTVGTSPLPPPNTHHCR